MLIKYSYLKRQFSNSSDLWKKLKKFVDTGDFTLGKELYKFEKNFSDFPCSPGVIISHVSTNKKGSLWGINFLISSISNFIFLNYFLLLLFSIN